VAITPETEQRPPNPNSERLGPLEYERCDSTYHIYTPQQQLMSHREESVRQTDASSSVGKHERAVVRTASRCIETPPWCDPATRATVRVTTDRSIAINETRTRPRDGGRERVRAGWERRAHARRGRETTDDANDDDAAAQGSRLLAAPDPRRAASSLALFKLGFGE